VYTHVGVKMILWWVERKAVSNNYMNGKDFGRKYVIQQFSWKVFYLKQLTKK